MQNTKPYKVYQPNLAEYADYLSHILDTCNISEQGTTKINEWYSIAFAKL